MRIGHITFGYKPIKGGEETYIANLVKILNEAGHSQRVYQPDTGIYDPELRPVPKLPKFLQFKGAALYFFNLALLSQFNELRKEDILIVHYAFHYPPVAWHKKVIIVSHGVEWEEPPTRLNHKIRKKIAQLAFKTDRCKLVTNDTDYFRRMGVNIKPKEKMFQEVLPGKWFIPNCVDISRFQPNEGLEELKKLNPILVPRNIVQQRGIDLAIRAFADFVKIYPETNLIIVGGPADDSNPVFQDLSKLIKSLKLENRVIFWGRIPWQEMPKIYSSALMTLIPSIFGEGTSLSALESMACHTPAIATNIGGLVDLPCILTNSNPRSLTQTMIETFKNRKQIAQEQFNLTTKIYNLGNWRQAWLKMIAYD